MRVPATAWLVALATAACGGGSHSAVCGPGTVLEGATCVPAVTCGQDTKPVGGQCVAVYPEPDEVAEFRELVNRMCNCVGIRCVTEVDRSVIDLSERHAERAKLDPEPLRELEKLMERYRQCSERVVGEVATPTDEELETGIPECDQLIARYLACDELPDTHRDVFKKAIVALRAEGAQDREAAAKRCTDGAAKIDGS